MCSWLDWCRVVGEKLKRIIIRPAVTSLWLVSENYLVAFYESRNYTADLLLFRIFIASTNRESPAYYTMMKVQLTPRRLFHSIFRIYCWATSKNKRRGAKTYCTEDSIRCWGVAQPLQHICNDEPFNIILCDYNTRSSNVAPYFLKL